MGMPIHMRYSEGHSLRNLMTLKRFIARCGKRNEFILDNAAHFKLSKSTIDIGWEKIVKDRTVAIYQRMRNKIEINHQIIAMDGRLRD